MIMDLMKSGIDYKKIREDYVKGEEVIRELDKRHEDVKGGVRKRVKLRKQRRKLKAMKSKQRAKKLKGQIKPLKAVRVVKTGKQEEKKKASKGQGKLGDWEKDFETREENLKIQKRCLDEREESLKKRQSNGRRKNDSCKG